jgi:hypothetical protein
MSGNVTIASGAERFALAHWNGTSFSIVGISPYAGAAGPLLELSPTNVWTVTYDDGADVDAAQWHGNGFSFHVLPPPPGQSDANFTPGQISGSGPTNIWIVGDHATATSLYGRIWHYNGSNWQAYLFSDAGADIFQAVAPLDATRTVVVAENNNNGTTTYAYTGTTRFHSIANNIPTNPIGPAAMIPGTTNFWQPVSWSSTPAIVELVSCR